MNLEGGGWCPTQERGAGWFVLPDEGERARPPFVRSSDHPQAHEAAPVERRNSHAKGLGEHNV